MPLRMRRHPILTAGAAALLALAVGAAWFVLRLPASLPPVDVAVVAPDEHAQAIAAMKPPKRARPVIAVLGDNDGSETTDYLVPYGVLRQSGVADLVALATQPGPLTLMPALTIQPQATVADFDARHPDGADYVIVPAMHNPDAPAVLRWIKSQHVKGATIVGVCSGARVLSRAGLLEGRAATGHWYDLDELRKDNPSMRWVPDRRYVADRGVVTTTGITASVPVSLALVEAIGGRARAEALAHELGVAAWEAGHDSKAFGLDRRYVSTALGNTLAFWSHQTLGVPVESGVDEIALAFTVDA
jgi:putative intracellular protease/amidase